MSRLTKHILFVAYFLLGTLFLPASVYGESSENLQNSMQMFRQTALGIQADINKLERDVLFPPLLRTDLYVSLKINEKQAKGFSLKQILIEVDGVEAVDYWYSVEQSNALFQGNKQLLWQGNVAIGKHRLKVVYLFVGKRGKAISGEKTFTFNKNLEQQPLLLNLSYEGSAPSVSLSSAHQ